MSCKTLQWIVLISVLVALLSVGFTQRGQLYFVVYVLMIPCFIGKCNSDCVSFLQSTIFAHISIFRCRRYVMIPSHAQKCSYHQIMALTDEKTCICDCVFMKKRSVRRFGFSSHVSKDDFLPEKTQERKGFIYDDCLQSPSPTSWGDFIHGVYHPFRSLLCLLPALHPLSNPQKDYLLRQRFPFSSYQKAVHSHHLRAYSRKDSL